MKTKISYSLLAATMACGLAYGQTTAYTTPVGYYNFDAKAGGNLFVPAFVNPAAFAGVITADGATTLTVATNAITANAFNSAGGYATHYVEITQAGANQGVVIDVVSNTNAVITLASNIDGLALTGTETIVVRPHVTLSSCFASAESTLVQSTDAVTFYNPDASFNTYYLVAPGDWSSDFVNNDGSARPIPPGTGVVLDVFADAELTIVGEVKTTDTVVQVAGSGVINIVGPLNPLVGDADLIKNLGFADMLTLTDSITIYPPGDLSLPFGTYFADGTGEVTSDFINPSIDTFSFTKGGIFTAQDNTGFRVKSGL